jgi:hypothetical protein
VQAPSEVRQSVDPSYFNISRRFGTFSCSALVAHHFSLRL